MFKKKPLKWLVTFIDSDDEKAFLNIVKLLEEMSKRLVKENIVTWVAPDGTREGLKEIGNEKDVKSMKITEDFSEVLLNNIIDAKKNVSANCVAVVLRRVQFYNDEVFETIVENGYFDDKSSYIICSRGNFLSLHKKLNCIRRTCKGCEEFFVKNEEDEFVLCMHSCLARLLFLIFDDKRTVTYLKNIDEEK